MVKFKVKYENEESPSNGKVFTVTEYENEPHYYFIADGEPHVGGGKLRKKYCTKQP